MGKKDSSEEPEMTAEEKAASEEYLSKLANSVLNRGNTPFPYKQQVKGEARRRIEQERRAAHTTGIQRKPETGVTPPPIQIPKPFSERTTPRPIAPTPQATPRPVAPSTPRPVLREVQALREAQAASSDGTFPVGTILLFEDGNVGVYKDSRPDKEYEVVSMLEGDGTVNARGLALENYDLKVIGSLPREFVLRLNRRGTWERDEIIYHLDSFDYCGRIPVPQASEETTRRLTTPSEATPLPVRKTAEAGLTAGRHFTISFGPGKDWGGVYWGEDELGSVVAHRTHEKWALMHLDLKRFQDSFKLGEMAGAEVMEQIRNDIVRG